MSTADNERGRHVTDSERFAQAVSRAAARERGGIGTMGEKGIHNTLKHYFQPDESCHEIPVGGYVADAVAERGVIEIQTRGFSRMRKKLESFLAVTRVTIVYPCVVKKKVYRVDKTTGEVVSSYRSPKKEDEYGVFWELSTIRDLLLNGRLSVCVVLLEAEEFRPADMPRGRGRRLRGGANGVERLPTGLVGEVWLECPLDYARYIPAGLPEQFDSVEFSSAAGLRVDRARSLLSVLNAVGLVERVGKRGNAYLYRVAENYSA